MSRTPDGLRRYVGVKEVCDALKISRSTLDRMRREGGFPPHQRISKNRVGWPVEVVEAHLAAQASAVSARAVLDPERLSKEDVATAFTTLGARIASERFGRAVTSSEIEGVAVLKTPAERAVAAKQHSLQLIAVMFLAGARLGPISASVVAGGLFPSIRDEVREMLEANAGVAVAVSDEQLQTFAANILYWAMWDESGRPRGQNQAQSLT